MEWRFTLIDRYNNQTVIEEPVGWTDFSIRIKRHPERHGTFRELQGNSFQFHGKAERLLKKEFEQYGINGNYRLLIEWKCAGSWAEFYTGTVSFDTYEHNCGTECYVQADIEQTGPVVAFINRFDQKVDVASAVAFDQSTALTAYPLLTKNITLPSKAILARGIYKNTAEQEYVLDCDTESSWYDCFGLYLGFRSGVVCPTFGQIDVNSIKTGKPASMADFVNTSHTWDEVTEIIYNDPEQVLNCISNIFDVVFRIKGEYDHVGSDSGGHDVTLVLKKGYGHWKDASNVTVAYWAISSTNNLPNTYSWDVNYAGEITLAPGEKLWLGYNIRYQRSTTAATGLTFRQDALTFFNATTESKCDDTQAKVYMINETMSRITEAITNNQLKVYSEYFGRTDSLPYSFASSGCGALRALALGLDIRRAKLGDGTDPKLFLSMADVFNHLAATDAVGIGVEGSDKVRVEPWKWFYKDDIILNCQDIDKLKKQIATSRIYSTFKVGYDKWETEDYNGQDEILTNREYRTQLSQVQHKLEQISKITASGYAIETTRRKGPEDKDWRYDNDVFAICLMNKVSAATSTFYAASKTIRIPFTKLYPIGFHAHTITITGSTYNDGTYTVVSVSDLLGDTLIEVAEAIINETGAAIVIEDISSHYAVELGAIDSPANMIDPATVYNFRISPARMAMHWFSRVMAFLKTLTSADKLIFSASEGNYIAKGRLKETACRMENVVLDENGDISIDKFEEEAANTPSVAAEDIEFKYPLSTADSKKIMASPYGLIEYKSGCESGSGWIDELTYFPSSGEAKFKLLPKISS